MDQAHGRADPSLDAADYRDNRVERLASEHVRLMLVDLAGEGSAESHRELERVERDLRAALSDGASPTAIRFEYDPREGGVPSILRGGRWQPLPLEPWAEHVLDEVARCAIPRAALALRLGF